LSIPAAFHKETGRIYRNQANFGISTGIKVTSTFIRPEKLSFQGVTTGAIQSCIYRHGKVIGFILANKQAASEISNTAYTKF
jgi:hypothetical protein